MPYASAQSGTRRRSAPSRAERSEADRSEARSGPPCWADTLPLRLSRQPQRRRLEEGVLAPRLEDVRPRRGGQSSCQGQRGFGGGPNAPWKTNTSHGTSSGPQEKTPSFDDCGNNGTKAMKKRRDLNGNGMTGSRRKWAATKRNNKTMTAITTSTKMGTFSTIEDVQGVDY